MFASAVHSIKAVLDVDVPGQYLDPPFCNLYRTIYMRHVLRLVLQGWDFRSRLSAERSPTQSAP